jgi:predicted NACHT family NTPase
LGEPGSGKTTALLELTRELIDRAKEYKKFPTPVVLNLSRWSEKRLSMDEWLIEELSFEYRYHQMTTTPWVHGQQILLLLDGLDEVRYEYRALCIDAINHFLEKYNAVDIVVCCRTDDYDDLDTQVGFAPFSRTVCL